MDYLASMLDEPLDPPRAKQLIREILEDGSVSFSGHAERELAKDNLTAVDAINVLRGGVVEPGEFENGSWRYRVRTQRIYVVVSSRSAPRPSFVS